MICNPCAELVRLVTMDDEDLDAWKAREHAPHFQVITARFGDTDTAIVVEPGTDHEKALEDHRKWTIRKGILPDEERLVARNVRLAFTSASANPHTETLTAGKE
jgi:hypothetical protein